MSDDRKFPCPFCDRSLKSEDGVQQHIQAKHPDKVGETPPSNAPESSPEQQVQEKKKTRTEEEIRREQEEAVTRIRNRFQDATFELGFDMEKVKNVKFEQTYPVDFEFFDVVDPEPYLAAVGIDMKLKKGGRNFGEMKLKAPWFNVKWEVYLVANDGEMRIENSFKGKAVPGSLEKFVEFMDLIYEEGIRQHIDAKDLGTIYFKREELDKAEQQYLEAVQRKPNYVNGWYNLAAARFNQKKYKPAIDALVKVLEFKKDDAEAWLMLGDSKKNGNYPTHEVRTAYKQALKYKPGWQMAQTRLKRLETPKKSSVGTSFKKSDGLGLTTSAKSSSSITNSAAAQRKKKQEEYYMRKQWEEQERRKRELFERQQERERQARERQRQSWDRYTYDG